jgi:hypothetical protein
MGLGLVEFVDDFIELVNSKNSIRSIKFNNVQSELVSKMPCLTTDGLSSCPGWISSSGMIGIAGISVPIEV